MCIKYWLHILKHFEVYICDKTLVEVSSACLGSFMNLEIVRQGLCTTDLKNIHYRPTDLFCLRKMFVVRAVNV